jgi:hypothetical protein
MPGYETIESAHDVVDLSSVLLGERGYHQTCLSSAIQSQDIPILLKAMEGAPDWSAADADVLRQLTLHDPGPRGQGALQDHHPDPVICGVAKPGIECEVLHSGHDPSEVSGQRMDPDQTPPPREAGLRTLYNILYTIQSERGQTLPLDGRSSALLP